MKLAYGIGITLLFVVPALYFTYKALSLTTVVIETYA